MILIRGTSRRVEASTGAAQPGVASTVQLRPAKAADVPLIQRAILRERLNPLALDPARFTVAERVNQADGSCQVVGFGQLKPLGSAALELSSLVVEPEARWVRPAESQQGLELSFHEHAGQVLHLHDRPAAVCYSRHPRLIAITVTSIGGSLQGLQACCIHSFFPDYADTAAS